jgi:hypothetical protein
MNFTAESFGGRSEAGDALVHRSHVVVLEDSDRIAMDNSLPAHYYKLSADQRTTRARARYKSILEELGDLDPQ